MSEGQIAFLAASGRRPRGLVQLSYAGLTRRSRGGGSSGPAGSCSAAASRPRRSPSASPTFAIPNVASRIGGSPQHPVGNGLLAEQFPPERRGFAISAHIAGGNVGTVVVAIVGVPLIAAGRLAWDVGRVRHPGDRHRGAHPAPGPRARHGPGRGQSPAAPSARVPADPRAIAICAGSTSRRSSAAAGAASAWSNLFALIYLTQGARPRRRDVRADVRRAHRLLGADAAGRRLAVRPDRAEAAHRRRLSRRRDRLRGVPARRVVARRPVGRHRPDGPVQLRREPAAPGAPRRHRAVRRSATRRSRCTSRSRSASGRCGRRSTGRSSRASARRPASRSCSA